MTFATVEENIYLKWWYLPIKLGYPKSTGMMSVSRIKESQ